jgi:hypothetical protein
MNLCLREARFEDAGTLLSVRHQAIMAIAPEYGVTAARRWADSASPNYAIETIGANTVFVAESELGIVGWVAFRDNTIEQIYARPDTSRVGTSLMERAEALIAAAGFEVAFLDASPNAVSFYEQRGYEVVAGPKADTSVPMAKPNLCAT